MKAESDEKIRKLSTEADEKIDQYNLELQSVKDRENDLLRRVQKLTVTENELRDKVKKNFLDFSHQQFFLIHSTFSRKIIGTFK